MPTYNGERFVAQQIASIVTQSPPPDELVVSDDGSTDATLECVREAMAGSGVELRLVGGEHLGLRANVQRVLEACTGDVIVMSDQDDVWLPDRLGAIAAAFEDPAVTLWFSDAELIDAEGARTGARLWDMVGFAPAASTAERPLRRLLHGVTVTGATMAVRRSVLEVALPLPNVLAERPNLYLHDGWIAVLAATLGTTVAEPRAFTEYRRHDAQTTAAGIAQLEQQRDAAPAPAARSTPAPAGALQVDHDRILLVWSRVAEHPAQLFDAGDRRTLSELQALYSTRTAPRGWRRSAQIAGHWARGRYRRYLRGTRTAAADLLLRRD